MGMLLYHPRFFFLFYLFLLLDLLKESTMGEDDIVEHSWKSGQVVRSSQTQSQRPTSYNSSPPPIHRGSGEENALLPHQNLFIQEDEMVPRLYQDYICSELVYSTLPTHSLSSSAPYDQIMNLSRLRGNIFTGGRVEAGPSMPVCSSATTESYLIPATHGTESRAMVIGGVSSTFTVPGRGRKEKAVAIQTVCEIAGTPSSVVQTESVKETEEAGGSTSRKRSRAAEMHNLSEKRRREKINEKMKALQELIPRCNKSDKASMLDDAIEYMKSLQMQTQMMSMGHGMMPPMMYAGNMQQFMPHMAMGMNRPPFVAFPGTPFPRPAHMVGLGPSYPAPRYPSPNIQASDPSRVHLPSPQPGSNQVLNQPQLLTYMNSSPPDATSSSNTESNNIKAEFQPGK